MIVVADVTVAVAGALLFGPGLGLFMVVLILGLLALAGAGRRVERSRPTEPSPTTKITADHVSLMPTDELARSAVRYHQVAVSMYEELERRQAPPPKASQVRHYGRRPG